MENAFQLMDGAFYVAERRELSIPRIKHSRIGRLRTYLIPLESKGIAQCVDRNTHLTALPPDREVPIEVTVVDISSAIAVLQRVCGAVCTWLDSD
jgi:hypothetical protein